MFEPLPNLDLRTDCCAHATDAIGRTREKCVLSERTLAHQNRLAQLCSNFRVNFKLGKVCPAGLAENGPERCSNTSLSSYFLVLQLLQRRDCPYLHHSRHDFNSDCIKFTDFGTHQHSVVRACSPWRSSNTFSVSASRHPPQLEITHFTLKAVVCCWTVIESASIHYVLKVTYIYPFSASIIFCLFCLVSGPG